MIYAQRITATSGLEWADNGIRLTSASVEYQLDAAIVADGVGGAIIVWEDYRGMGMVGIYGQHVDGSGTPQWGPWARPFRPWATAPTRSRSPPTTPGAPSSPGKTAAPERRTSTPSGWPRTAR